MVRDNQNNNNNLETARSDLTAALVIIGNEILSGRTQDINTKFLAENLTNRGIKLKEVSIIPDDKATIASKVSSYKEIHDYVFTTGGIGPTHDDITAESIALGLGRNLILNEEAVSAIEKYYGKDSAELSRARVKMAYLPEGSEIITNSLTGAPGFKIENIFVLAGVPDIMRSMFESIVQNLAIGSKIYSQSIDIYKPESEIASTLTQIQEQFTNVEIGSYPFSKNFKIGCQVALNSTDKQALDKAFEQVKTLLLES